MKSFAKANFIKSEQCSKIILCAMWVIRQGKTEVYPNEVANRSINCRPSAKSGEISSQKGTNQ